MTFKELLRREALAAADELARRQTSSRPVSPETPDSATETMARRGEREMATRRSDAP